MVLSKPFTTPKHSNTLPIITNLNNESSEKMIEKAQSLYTQQLPFVCTEQPFSNKVSLHWQTDDTLHYFQENRATEGFLFAPFSSDSPTVFLPFSTENTLESYLPTEKADIPTQTALPNNEAEKAQHIALVAKAVQAIQEGKLEKVVLSRKITLNKAADPIKSFQNMLVSYPSAYCYLFYHPQVGTWLAATPEVLLHYQNGHFSTMALAGTQPVKEGEILWHTKEKEEQQIVTNTIVAQLEGYATCCEVAPAKTVRAGGIVHLCTEIKGDLPNNLVFKTVERLHPTPAVCGYPTDKARQFILENEPYHRKYYTGYCGEMQEGKELRLYVNLRCMEISNNHTYLYVGGGITKDSVPEKEYEETQNKAQTMYKIIA